MTLNHEAFTKASAAGIAAYDEACRERDDGWIRWTGGECPVDDDTLIEMRMESGALWDGPASMFSWVHMDDDQKHHRLPARQMIARLHAWLQARHLKWLEAQTRAAAGTYSAFKSRYEIAQIEAKLAAERKGVEE